MSDLVSEGLKKFRLFLFRVFSIQCEDSDIKVACRFSQSMWSPGKKCYYNSVRFYLTNYYIKYSMLVNAIELYKEWDKFGALDNSVYKPFD